MKCDVWSHPSFQLVDHLMHVYKYGMQIYNNSRLFRGYEECLKASLILHDIGKASGYFQSYIRGDTDVNSNLRRHSEISALWVYYYLLQKNHEDPLIPLFGYLMVYKHHGNLDNFLDMFTSELSHTDLQSTNTSIDYCFFTDEMKDILPDVDRIIAKDNFSEVLVHRKNLRKIARKTRNEFYNEKTSLIFNYLYSILLTADKQSAIFRDDRYPTVKAVWLSNYPKVFKDTLKPSNSVIDIIRKMSFEAVDDKINNIDLGQQFLSINLPTGSGKTITALYAALKLRERLSEKRKVIYCLPYTSIIDQNADVLQKILEGNGIVPNSDVLLIHHHLSSLNYVDEELDDYSFDKSLWLIENWQSDVVVTTFYQFLNSLFTNKNRHLKRFSSLTNSIVILDEVQTIPVQYFLLIREVMLNIAKSFNIHFILTTATMPLIFREEANEIVELATNKRTLFNMLSRVNLIRQKTCSLTDFLDKLSKEIEGDPNKSRLIILNTIRASKDAYNYLKKYRDRIVYLSTDIVPEHRLKRINDLKENSQGRIVISTQMVEAGVDIDMDVVYRDMAPLDSLFQACGRCNRNYSRSEPSEVKLLELYNEQGKLYWSYVYDIVLVEKTKKIIMQDKVVNEKDFHHLSILYYNELWENKSHLRSEILLDRINKQQYRWAFVNDDDNTERSGFVFQLIEELPRSTLFIELDQKAQQAYNSYKKQLTDDSISSFERRTNILQAYRKLAPYIISVPKSAVYTEDLNIIERSEINLIYDMQTGYKREEQQSDYIF